jgi:hypothetical protein
VLGVLAVGGRAAKAACCPPWSSGCDCNGRQQRRRWLRWQWRRLGSGSVLPSPAASAPSHTPQADEACCAWTSTIPKIRSLSAQSVALYHVQLPPLPHHPAVKHIVSSSLVKHIDATSCLVLSSYKRHDPVTARPEEWAILPLSRHLQQAAQEFVISTKRPETMVMKRRLPFRRYSGYGALPRGFFVITLTP